MSFHHNWFNFNEDGPSSLDYQLLLPHTLSKTFMALEESIVLVEIKFTVLPLDFKPAWLFPQPQNEFEVSLSVCTLLFFLSCLFRGLCPLAIYLPVSLRMNCVLAAIFLWAALVLYFPPCRWRPVPLLLLSCPMNLHSCLWTDVILITPCRAMLIHIINVLKCTLF